MCHSSSSLQHNTIIFNQMQSNKIYYNSIQQITIENNLKELWEISDYI